MVDMVVVEFEYEEMRKLLDLPRDKMVGSLSDLGAPSEYEPEVKKIITEITPNRPDWYSMEGLARSLKTYHNNEHMEYSARKSDYRVIVDPSVEKSRPYTVCAVVKGLKFNGQRVRDAVLLQEKLIGTLGRKVKRFGLGIYPLSTIKFPVRYTTMKPEEIRYTPLGADHEMSADEILKNHKKGQQYGHLLKGQGRYPVFVDAQEKIMALIPIVNSAQTGKIDESTKDIFMEVSGVDIHSCKAALNILACTFADMGGEIFEVMMEYEKGRFVSPDLSNKKMKLEGEQVKKILGLGLSEKEIGVLLAKMGYKYAAGTVQIPPYRADVMDVIDIIEDIAIAYGYNNFKPTLPDFFNPGDTVKKHDELDRVLRGMGFLENKTFILTNKENLKKMGFEGDIVEITNPSTADYTVVRPNLIINALEGFSVNKMKGLPQRSYEIGVVYSGKQEKRLIFSMMDRKIEFSDFRGYLQTLAFEMGFDFELKKIKDKVFEPGVAGIVVSGGKEIGVFGRVEPGVLGEFGIGFDVYICELKV
jgi:phenylalanyl-tRNA synthetase beta chain